MKRLIAVMSLTALLTGLSACGFSSRGDVVSVEPGPSGQVDEKSEGTRTAPGWDGRLVDPKELVRRFLTTTAGDYSSDARKKTVDRARNFLTPGIRGAWKPKDTELKVVRLLGDPVHDPEGGVVTVPVQNLGLLKDDGKLEQPESDAVETVVFHVAQSNGAYVIAKDPGPALMLSDKAFAEFYKPVTLYYPAGDRHIPDFRFLSRELASEQFNTRQVEWLLGRPSLWLQQIVSDLPPNIKLNGSVTDEQGSLVIDLSREAVPVLDRLKAQFARTLTADVIKINIVGIERASQQRIVRDEPLSPTRWGVVNGRVISPSGSQIEVKQRNVSAVAFSGGNKTVALVVKQGNQEYGLFVGDPANPRPVPQLQGKAAISQPIWLDHENRMAVVLVDGALWVVTGNDKGWQAHKMAKLPPRVDSFAISPEGLRLAYRVGDHVSMVTLTVVPEDDLLVETSRMVPVPLGELQSLAFTTERHLVIAGKLNTEVMIAEVTVDGVQFDPSNRRGYKQNTKIRHLVAYPMPDGPHRNRDYVMAVIGEDAIERVFADPIPVTWASPNPSVAPSASPPPSQRVTAPSYEG